MTDVQQELVEVTRSIWAAVVGGLEIDLVAQPPDAALGADPGPTVTSIVHLDGAWRGAVILRCDLPLAEALAAAMFAAGDDEPGGAAAARGASAATFDDVRDALGEVTNMVAGNLKPLLPQPSGLSLPAVALGSDYEIGVVGASPIAQATFVCRGRPLTVSVVRRDESVTEVRGAAR